MSGDDIRAALQAGEHAADIARRLCVPLTAVCRVRAGGDLVARRVKPQPCSSCGAFTARRGGIVAICETCRGERQRLRSTACCAVRKAVAIGMLPKASSRSCTDCGRPATEHDHRDYRRPLDVQPVCRSCNLLRGPAEFHERDQVAA